MKKSDSVAIVVGDRADPLIKITRENKPVVVVVDAKDYDGRHMSCFRCRVFKLLSCFHVDPDADDGFSMFCCHEDVMIHYPSHEKDQEVSQTKAQDKQDKEILN